MVSVFADKETPEIWHVEWVGSAGQLFKAHFEGPTSVSAQGRAEDYADWVRDMLAELHQPKLVHVEGWKSDGQLVGQ